jgi:hypothetical protein
MAQSYFIMFPFWFQFDLFRSYTVFCINIYAYNFHSNFQL